MSKTKVITGKVRFSYANVWEKRAVNGGEERYSVSLIIPKMDKRTIESIEKAIDAAIELGGKKFGEVWMVDAVSPLKDGDFERADEDAYKDSFFLNASSKDKPQIVDKNIKIIEERSEFYSGCYGRASLIFYPFDINGNKGVGCGLCNLQKLSDGEILSLRTSAEDDFREVNDDFLS